MNLGFPENKKARVWFYLILPALLNLSLFFHPLLFCARFKTWAVGYWAGTSDKWLFLSLEWGVLKWTSSDSSCIYLIPLNSRFRVRDEFPWLSGPQWPVDVSSGAFWVPVETTLVPSDGLRPFCPHFYALTFSLYLTFFISQIIIVLCKEEGLPNFFSIYQFEF